MKINKIAEYQSRLIESKLIKTKIYKKNERNFIGIEDIIARLKKVLHIIYKYHSRNKRILFIGTPLYLDKKLETLIKKTIHAYIPESAWMNGILTNQKSCFKYLLKNQQFINRRISKFLVEAKEKSDLIVILDSSVNPAALNEGYLTRTPVISLSSRGLDVKSSYVVPGNFKFINKTTRNNFFYSILHATIKKAQPELTYYKLHNIRKSKQKKLPVKKFNRYSYYKNPKNKASF